MRHADAYTKLWGPTTSIVPTFYDSMCKMSTDGRRVKICQARVDKIKALSDYKDKSSSTFLFYVVRYSRRRLEHVGGVRASVFPQPS